MSAFDTIQRCEGSRDRRRRWYRTLRTLLRTGTTEATLPIRHNKLRAHLELLSSYLYAPEGTQFSLTLPPHDREPWLEAAELARDALVRQWRDTGCDVRFASIVERALELGAALVKLLPDPEGQERCAWVDPGQFGVLREDLSSIDDQDAFCHWFWLSIPELERLTRGLPDQAEILADARQLATSGVPERELSGPISSILVSSVAGQTVTGTVQLDLGPEGPEVLEPLVECVELWERSEFKDGPHRYQDYWVTTVMGRRLLFGRRNPVLPWRPGAAGGEDLQAENPFVAVVPAPELDYFWGASELTRLWQLQKWREDRMRQVDELFRRQLRPPVLFSGVAVPDERLKALHTDGGYLASPTPNAQATPLVPQAPQNVLEFIKFIDEQFAEASGIPELLAAGTAQGLRAGVQVAASAQLAAGRIRKRALIVEDALEVVATRLFHLLQRHDPKLYTAADGRQFLLSELSPWTVVKVSAHSSSPVYREQVIQKAEILLRAGAIDLPTFVTLVDPPMAEALREKARVLQAAKAKQMQALLEIQRMKAEKGRGR